MAVTIVTSILYPAYADLRMPIRTERYVELQCDLNEMGKSCTGPDPQEPRAPLPPVYYGRTPKLHKHRKGTLHVSA